MKKNLLFFMTLLAFNGLFAQKDTLFYENFEKETTWQTMLTTPSGKDTEWVNWDKDGKAPGEGTNQNWYKAPEVYQAQVTKPPVQNQTAHSLSWLKGDIPGSRNILISPPVLITDDKATLSWRACPLQGPAFMDGYKILVTAASNDVTKAKPDTLFVAAEVTSYKDPGTLALSDFKFSKGRIHADGYKLKQYWDTTGLTTFHRGRLEPQTVSLAKYKGKKIYIHVYHDSDDDYIFEIDDILVLGNKSVGTQNTFASDVRLVTYPNPTTDFLNVLYRTNQSENVAITVVNMEGKQVLRLFEGNADGEMNHHFNVSQLPTAPYLLEVKIGDKVAIEKFVKK